MNRSPRLPYIVKRDGRPRFVPSPDLRRLGFKGRDLKHPDGTWFSDAETYAEAGRLYAEIDAARGGHVKQQREAAPGLVTLGQLLEECFRLPAFTAEERQGKRIRQPLKPATVIWYRKLARVIEQVVPDVYEAPAAALGGERGAPLAQALVDRIEIDRGLYTARGVRALLSTAWNRLGVAHRLGNNPFERISLPMPPGDKDARKPEEVLALIAAADRLGRPEIADMLVLGLVTAQRQNDRLTLIVEQAGDRLDLVQHKTGMRVSLPRAAPFCRRHDAAMERRRAHTVQWREAVIDEQACRPFQPDHYRKVFAKVRREAAKLCPSVATFKDRDLRDTALTWAYEGLRQAHGPDIAKSKAKGLSGHKGSNAAIMERHYLDVRAHDADDAVAAMLAFLDGKGFTL